MECLDVAWGAREMASRVFARTFLLLARLFDSPAHVTSKAFFGLTRHTTISDEYNPILRSSQ